MTGTTVFRNWVYLARPHINVGKDADEEGVPSLHLIVTNVQPRLSFDGLYRLFRHHHITCR